MFDKRIVQEGRPVWGFLLLSVGLGLGITLLAVAQAWLFSRVVAGVFLAGDTLKTVRTSLELMLGIIVLRAAAQWLSEISAHEAAARLQFSLRQRLLSQIVSLGPVYTQGERAGELITTVVEGIESLEEYIAKYLPQLLQAVGIPLLILVFVFPRDWESGLILLLTGPLIPVFMILIGKLAEKKSLQQFQSLSWMSAHFLDVLQGLTTLKVFGRAKDQTRVIERVSESFRKTTLSVLRIAFLSALVLEFLATLSTALVAVAIGLRLVYGTLSFSSGLFLLLLAPEFYTPLRTLGLNFHAGLSGANAAERIFEILNLPVRSEVEDDEDNLKIGSDFLISIQDVSLTYQLGETQALDGISLLIRSGEKIALVGPSGAGKTSLVQLLLRFTEPTAGGLYLNGRLLQTVSLEKWRNKIAYVPQNPFLFAGSIAENIRFGRPGATTEEVRHAAQKAFADQFIRELPDGYQTQLGEGGARLSGGQAQRIAIARAILKDASLLILDEATSGLDPESERYVQQAWQQLIQSQQDKTVIIIAHRLNTVRQAERILVMDQGQIVEQGKHEELMSKQGLYYQMVTEYRGEAI